MKTRSMKIIPILAVLCLMAVLLPVSPAGAQGPVISITVGTPVAGVEVGCDFVASVNITEVADFAGYDFRLTYDPDILNISEINWGLMMPSAGGPSLQVPNDGWAFFPAETQGVVRVFGHLIQLGGVNTITGSGYLCEITFHVMGTLGQSSLLTLSNIDIRDGNAQHIDISQPQNGEIDIITGPTHLAFTTSPAGAVADTPFTTQPQVAFLNADNRIVANSTAEVDVNITPGTGTAGAVLSGTTTVAAANGVASFTDLSIDLIGTGYTLTATSGSNLTPGVSNPFNVTAPTMKLVFTTSPEGATVGEIFDVQPVVQVQDLAGNPIDSDALIRLDITTGTGTDGAFLAGTTELEAVDGVASFTDLAIDLVGAGYTLTASSQGMARGFSNAFNVAGPANMLAFTVTPADAIAGEPFGTQPVVAILDAEGNPTSDSAEISVELTPGSGTPGALLSGTKTIMASNGLALFTDLSIDLIGTGYNLTATSPDMGSAVSFEFNVAGGPPDTLIFVVSPAGATQGLPFVVQPVVAIEDADGNPTSSTAEVSVAITPGSGVPGAVLSGEKTIHAENGTAYFSDLSIDLAGAGYNLTATCLDLTPVTSEYFNVSGPALKLVFTTSPEDALAGIPFGIQPVVEVQDADGNIVNTEVVISLAITPGTGTAGAQLSGETSIESIDGTAAFSDLSVDLIGAGYTLTATSPDLVDAVSQEFNVSGPANKLVFAVSPEGATAGEPFDIQPVVTILDADDNPTSSIAEVSVEITAGTGTEGAMLLGTTTIQAVNGQAVFTDLAIDLIGAGYTLTATSPDLEPAESLEFNVGGPANMLIFTVSPSGATAGIAFVTQPVVLIMDAQGNPTSDTAEISVEITPGSGTEGAVLSGTKTLQAINGEAVFTDLMIDQVGVGYNLTATSPDLAPAVSDPFDVTPPLGRLVFTRSPGGALAGSVFTTQPMVSIQDIQGNPLDEDIEITVAITKNTGTPEAVLSGTITVQSVNGQATFTDLSIDLPGQDYTLTASSPEYFPAASSAFDVIGVPVKLVFTRSPTKTTVNIALKNQPLVSVQDVAGNQTDAAVDVTLEITAGTGAAGAVLSGAKTITSINGLATFAGLKINKKGDNYQLTATSPGLESAESAAFNIAAASTGGGGGGGGGGGAALDLIKPTVTSVTPANNATDVAVDTILTAVFSEPVNPSSVTTASFRLLQGTTPVSGTVTYDSTTRTAKFVPAAKLEVNTLYSATITTTVVDLALNNLAANYTWSFTTTVGKVQVSLIGLSPKTPLELDTNGILQAAAKLKTLDGNAGLDIARGTKMLDASNSPLKLLAAGAMGTPPNAPADNALVLAYTFLPGGAAFAPDITLSMSYGQGALPKNVNEKDLYLGVYDGAKWNPLQSTVDTQGKMVSAKLSHFSNYALLGKITALPPASPTTAPPTTTAAPPPTTTPPPPPATTAAPTATSTPTPAPSGPPWGLIGGIIGGVIVVGLIVFFILRRRRR